MKRRPLLMLFVLLVAGVGLFVWKSSRAAPDKIFMLADGSQLTFLAFTAGTNHSHCFGNPLQRVAAGIPGRLGEILSGGTLIKYPVSSSTNLVFWFSIRKNPSLASFNTVQPLANGRARALFRFRFKDDKGDDLPGSVFRSERQFRSGNVGMFTYSTNLPPASPTIRLKLTTWRGPADEEESTEFIAPNPRYRQQP